MKDMICDLEIAKRLKELGIKQDAYMVYNVVKTVLHKYSTEIPYKLNIRETDKETATDNTDIYSAFTTIELLKILPDEISGYRLLMEKDTAGYWERYRLPLYSKNKKTTAYFIDDKLQNALGRLLVFLIEESYMEL